MNWYKGTIAEAVTVSKQRNATFVVYVEGKDESSGKLSGFLNQPIIKEKLESDNFVAIRIQGGSDAYMQFARIYQIVPVPSLFFIGKNGTPLEIATGMIGSSEELDKKIENVLKLTGTGSTTAAAQASVAFIASEQKKETQPSTSKDAQPEVSQNIETPAAPAPEPVQEQLSPEPASLPDAVPITTDEPSSIPDVKTDAVVTEVLTESPTVAEPVADTSFSLPSPKPITDEPTAPSPVSTPPIPAVSGESEPTAAEKVEETKRLIEERRKLKQAEEDRQEREKELKRRKEGKIMQNVQQWQKEQDFKVLKETIKRDRLEDQAARQRILEQIASDRAERAKKFIPPIAPVTPPKQPTSSSLASPPCSDQSRIQFRIPNGETNTQTFESSDTFSTVRNYVKNDVIKGTGIRDFTLATTFPKHEFTAEDDMETLSSLGLCPTAVILVITKSGSGPSAVVRSGGFINIFNTLFWALLSPVFALFGYVRNFITGHNDGGERREPRPANVGVQKRANEEQVDPNDSAKKRNLDRFQFTKDGPSTSKEALATANSTGTAYRRVGSSNVHRLSDQRNDSDDENNTWNGNSTQQQ